MAKTIHIGSKTQLHERSLVGSLEKAASFFPEEKGSVGGKVIVNLILMICKSLSYGPQILLRRNFGERHFDMWTAGPFFTVLFGVPFLLFGFSNTLTDASGESFGVSDVQVVAWFFMAVAVWGMFSFHRVRIFVRNRKGHIWHASSIGETLRVLDRLDVIGAKYRFTQPFSRIIGEPAIMVAVGIVLSVLGLWLVGVWFIASAIFHAIYEILCWSVEYHCMLDERDSKIERGILEEVHADPENVDLKAIAGRTGYARMAVLENIRDHFLRERRKGAETRSAENDVVMTEGELTA